MSIKDKCADRRGRRHRLLQAGAVVPRDRVLDGVHRHPGRARRCRAHDQRPRRVLDLLELVRPGQRSAPSSACRRFAGPPPPPRAAAAAPVRSASPRRRSTAGMATTVVTLMTLQQLNKRLGGSAVGGMLGYAMMSEGGEPVRRQRHPPVGRVHRQQRAALAGAQLLPCSPSATCTCTAPSASTSPRSCISTRDNAIKRPTALRTDPLTLDDYFNARMINDPLCLFDYTMESDGAVAVITTSAERAKDLKQPPVLIIGSAHGGTGAGGRRCSGTSRCPTTSSRRPVTVRSPSGSTRWPASARATSTSPCCTTTSRRWSSMQLEDYGFCPIGEGGAVRRRRQHPLRHRARSR